MRSLICLISLVLVLSLAPCSRTSATSEQELLPLSNSLDLIESGLNLIDAPLSEIQDYFKSEQQELLDEKSALDLEKLNLDSRDKALQERAKVLDWREDMLLDNWLILNKAEDKIRRAKAWGIVIVVGALVLGAAGGYALGSR